MVGRNLDTSNQTLFLVRSEVEGSHKSLNTAALAFHEYALDGINEKGVFIGEMTIVDPAYAGILSPDYPKRPSVFSHYMMRIVLDICASVDEAVALFSRVPVWCTNDPWHFFLADAAGNFAVVEYDKSGQLAITRQTGGVLVSANTALMEGRESLMKGLGSPAEDRPPRRAGQHQLVERHVARMLPCAPVGGRTVTGAAPPLTLARFGERLSRESKCRMPAPTVFISYSHDSNDHCRKVLALSERLRADGIETFLDQYENSSPPEGWPRWMMNQLDRADYVIVVCSETYYRRFRGHEEPGEGNGVDWEAFLITSKLYAARSRSLRFVPVFLSAPVEGIIPDPLRGLTYYAVTSEEGYERLYDFLLQQAGVEPGVVGAIKSKPRAAGAPMTFVSSTPGTDSAASGAAGMDTSSSACALGSADATSRTYSRWLVLGLALAAVTAAILSAKTRVVLSNGRGDSAGPADQATVWDAGRKDPVEGLAARQPGALILGSSGAGAVASSATPRSQKAHTRMALQKSRRPEGPSANQSQHPDRSWCAPLSYCHDEGRCTDVDNLCVATRDDDCANSVKCRTSGFCAARLGACIATSVEHCKASEGCRKHGQCSLKSGACIAE